MKRALLVVLFALSSGCRSVEEERYELRGKVVGVDRERRTVTVDHEEVEGLMPSMTMPFPVRDDRAFESLAPGDGLNAILVVQEGGDRREFWLQELVISRALSSGPEGAAPAAPRIGELLPDTELVDQDGTAFRLSDRRGKALLITFVYTRCPLVDYCPRMTHQFAALEGKLRAEPSLYDRTHLLTISFDPDHDTPERLKAYAGGLGIAAEETFAHWEFATGSPESIRELATFLQLEYRTEAGEIVHNLRTALVAPDGTLKAIYRGNDWTPEEVLKDVSALLGSP